MSGKRPRLDFGPDAEETRVSFALDAVQSQDDVESKDFDERPSFAIVENAKEDPYNITSANCEADHDKKMNIDSPAVVRAKANFINFQKSGGNETYAESKPVSGSDAANINLRDHISAQDIEAKQKFLRQLVCALERRAREGGNKSDTDTLSQSAQYCKVNPVFLHIKLSDVEKNDYPSILQGRKLPSIGFLCEIRIQGIYFGIGFSVSKQGAKDRASENVLKILKCKEVCVLPIQRRWKDKKFPEFILSASLTARKDIPPFYHPPEGTQEHKLMKKFGQKGSIVKNKVSLDDQNTEKPKEGFLNIAHMGPPSSGKPLESFVIILNDENPVCVMNTSAQFSKMSVDYYFEKPCQYSNDFIVTVFIEGNPVADAKGPKKVLKHRVSELALQCLNKFCLTVVTNKEVLQTYNAVSRQDIKFNQNEANAFVKTTEDGSIGGVGEKMMKMMGWTEGGEIGDRFKVKREVIKIENESINREGLGSKAINSDNITREEAQDIVKQYAASESVEELVFSSELNFDERMEIRYMAKRFNLAEKLVAVPFGKGKKVFLVLSKKVDNSVIIRQLEKDGQFGKYQLVRPAGGDRNAVKRYLTFQHLRKVPGVPEQIQKESTTKETKIQWKDKTRIKPLMEALDYRSCTTFDASGNIKTADEFYQSRIQEATGNNFRQRSSSYRAVRGESNSRGFASSPGFDRNRGGWHRYATNSPWNGRTDWESFDFDTGFMEQQGEFPFNSSNFEGGFAQQNFGFNARFDGNSIPDRFTPVQERSRGRSNYSRGSFSRFGRRGF